MRICLQNLGFPSNLACTSWLIFRIPHAINVQINFEELFQIYITESSTRAHAIK